MNTVAFPFSVGTFSAERHSERKGIHPPDGVSVPDGIKRNTTDVCASRFELN